MGCGIGPNALDHGRKPVGALRREVVLQPQVVEDRFGIGRQDLLGRAVLVDCEQNGNQTANNVGVAVTVEVQACARGGRVKPDLAGAASDLVVVVALIFRKFRQFATELDHITVAVFPIVEEGEVFADLVEGHLHYCLCRLIRGRCLAIGTDGGPARWLAAGGAITTRAR